MYNLIWSDSPPRCLDVEGKCLTLCLSFQFARPACCLWFYLRAVATVPLLLVFPLAVQSLCGFCCVLSSWGSLSSVCPHSVPSARGKAPNDCFAFKMWTLCLPFCSGRQRGYVTRLPVQMVRAPTHMDRFPWSAKKYPTEALSLGCASCSHYSATRCCTLEYSLSLVVVNLKGGLTTKMIELIYWWGT